MPADDLPTSRQGPGPPGLVRVAVAGSVVALALSLASCSGRAPAADHPPSATSTSTLPADASAAWGVVDTAYVGSGPKVAVLGDSLMVASADQLRAALSDHSLRVAAVRGEGLSGGPMSTRLGQDTMADLARAFARDHPAVAVIALGTNDAWSDELTLAAGERAVTEIGDAFADACRVVVTATEDDVADGYDPGEAKAINRALRAIADEVVDGDQLTAEPGSTGSDGIHTTAIGAARRSSAIAAAVRRCDR